MPAEGAGAVLYWDASALLSALVADAHTAAARRLLKRNTHHLVSSLAAAEILAVLARLERGAGVGAEAVAAACSGFLRGPWRWTRVLPEASACADLSRRHGLGGADLWHLAAALALRERLPELKVLTFRAALREASEAEGLLTV